MDSQIAAFDFLTSKKGFAIGGQSGKVYCYDLLKEGLNFEIVLTVNFTENQPVKILKSFRDNNELLIIGL